MIDKEVKMHPLVRALSRHPEFRRLVLSLEDGEGTAAVFGIGESQRGHMAAAIHACTGKTVLVATANEVSAARLAEDIAPFSGNVAHFPPRDMPLALTGYTSSTGMTARRMDVLRRLDAGEPMIITTSATSLMQRMVAPREIRSATHRIKMGERHEPKALVASLVAAGYERVEVCEGKGQICLRGGYLDVFPITSVNPVRVEFFDDEVDTMREYDPLTQRSIENVKSVEIPPATELVLSAAARERGKKAMKKRERLSAQYETLCEGGTPAEIVSLLPMFYDEAYFLDYLPDDAIMLIDEPSRLEESARVAYTELTDGVASLLLTKEAEPEEAMLLNMPSRMIASLDTKRSAMLFALTRSYSLISPKSLFKFETRSVPKYMGLEDTLVNDIRAWRKNGASVLLYAGTHAQRLKDMLGDGGLTVPAADELEREITQGEILIVAQSIMRGFEYPEIRLVAISETELYGASAKKPSTSKKKKPQLAFSELSVGDLIVHETHGIGRFVGVETLNAAGVTRDYLKLVYMGGDSLYIPTDQLDRVQKYIGGDEEKAHLSKLGSGEWQKTVSRTRDSVKKLAFDLVRLYGERMNRKGFAYSKDTAWQRKLEDSFPYEETPDQLTCIEEIKRDMENERVMDRLLCGDVGYGKTEVALRAAFKAVQDSKQVAFLVPTTILAAQHYNTLATRFSGYPVNVQLLSRFKTPAQEKAIRDGLANGTVDVVVGTHKLLSESIQYRDLGLLIVDEEQRFGVGHKEQIKNLKRNIDVLTLSATPIPRTLHMSMTGIRDMSVIETPPEQRYPVQTYVLEYGDTWVREAILKELGRGGQVYFVYNKVKTMERFADYLRGLVPEARVAYAHGQMSERQLEKTMLDFMEQQYDVLLCSTIIESGLDIQNVNTIIVSDADCMGLSQLYQLRGRVGRGARLGYAYLSFKRDKVLNEIAEKRLSAIREFTQFGAGFKIAMRDLEIRGAGNLLGAEQHGHMAAVGYDLYCKIVDSAVKEVRGIKTERIIDTVMDVPLSASIPHDYMPREEERLAMYKRIASVTGREDVYDVQDELIDRYGEIPENTQNLLDIALLKAAAGRAFISKLSVKDGEAKLIFVNDAPINATKLFSIANEIDGAQILMKEEPTLVIRRKKTNAPEMCHALPQIVYTLADCIDAAS